MDDPENDIGYVTDLAEDRSGQLWAASSTGLYQYRAGPFTPFGSPEGVANQTFVVASGAGNSVWTGTEASGLFNVYPDGKVRQYTTADGLPSNAVSAIMVDADKSIWIGTFGGGLAQMKNHQIVRRMGTQDGLAGDQIGSIYRDRAGDVWVGSNAGLNRLSDWEVTATLTVDEGLLNNQVRDLREDSNGNLLISGDNGLTIISPRSLQVLDRVDGSKGLANAAIATTFVDNRGVTWIGGRSSGLVRKVGDQLFQYLPEHNVQQTSVMTIIEDRSGYLWLGGRDGITRIARSELDAVARGSANRVTARTFSDIDGLRATRVSGGYQSASTLADDGRLWLATTGGLAAVEPDKLSVQGAPPTLFVEAVRADGQTVAMSGNGKFRIPAGTQSVQIDYSVPSINAAESLRFHYRLGEARWQDAAGRRTAFFSSLPARDHSFQVGVRLDGQPVGNGTAQPTTVALFVEPLWHQSYAARISFVLAFFLLLWTGYGFALRYYRLRQKHLEKLVDERTSALRDALSEVRAMSRVDKLTGIANRRHFEERIEEVWAAATRENAPVSIMMIDIDHFKQFNDSAGHQEGDRCLAVVAQNLRESVRGGDFVARYGGEEFAVLLSGNDIKKVSQIAQRLQKSIRELRVRHPGLGDGAVVTISAGFATVRPTREDNVEDLIQRADEALYQAKEQGRDRVVFAEPFQPALAVAGALG